MSTIQQTIDGAAAADQDPEVRFRILFEQAPFSVQLVGPDGRTRRVNRAWEALWVPPGDTSVLPYVLGRFNLLEDPQLQANGVADHLRRAFAGESVEVPAVAYDPALTGHPGPVRWVRAQMHPVRDEAGAVVEVMLIHQDVSEQMQAEQVRAESERRLHQLANTIPQLAWIADRNGEVLWYNDRWYDYTGSTAAAMRGTGWQAAHDPAALPQLLERWHASLRNGEPFEMTFPLRGRDGRYRPFLTKVAPLKDEQGQVLQWFGTNTDVSALHEAQTGLQQAEERLRLATLAGNIGIWEWDVATDRVSWSDEVYRLHGVAPGGFGGHAADFAALVHPDDRDRLWQQIGTAIREHAGFSAEFRVIQPDGRIRWLSTWARAHRGSEDSAARLVGAAISIDMHKQAEAALRDNDRRKDEFLAMLAHELRNPLSAISTASQVLQLGPEHAHQIRRASDVIDRQIRHITALVDDLLDVSRVTRGLAELAREEVDLALVLAHAVEQAQPAIEARRHALVQSRPAESAHVMGDLTRLVQAVANLLSNAAKYTPPGGEIGVALEVQGTLARIRVSDNGIGISAALLPSIFDLFTQGDRAPGRVEGGLGIGLALVRSIVELHGGEVCVESAGLGRGSCFTLSLPMLTQPSSASAAARPDPTDRTPAVVARDVMIVDDHRDAAEVLAVVLQSAGHRTTVRHSAAAALAALDDGAAVAPEIFILDIGLPSIDGYELARRLRTRRPNARLIALTGYGQQQDRERSAAAGFDHHLVKPVRPHLLFDLLAQL